MGDKQQLSSFFDPLYVKWILKKESFRSRSRALHCWKMLYRAQKIAVANVYEKICAHIRQNPDCDIDDLELPNVSKKLLHAYSWNIMSIFWRYQKRRVAIMELRRQYPDNAQLFARIFGRPPIGDVDIIVGPMTLYFRCFNLEDYTRIYAELFSSHRDVTDKQKEKAVLSRGVAIFSAPYNLDGLRGSMLAERATSRAFGKRAEKIYTHEEQHAILHLIREVITVSGIRDPFYPFSDFLRVAWKRDEILFHSLLTRLFKKERKRGELRAHDEILAYTTMGMSSKRIIEFLLQKEEDGGLYDYFKETRLELLGLLTRQRCLPDYFDDLYHRIFEKEYHQLIKNAVMAIDRLVAAGFSATMCIGMLLAEPLSKWPRVVGIVLDKRRCGDGKNTSV